MTAQLVGVTILGALAILAGAAFSVRYPEMKKKRYTKTKYEQKYLKRHAK